MRKQIEGLFARVGAPACVSTVLIGDNTVDRGFTGKQYGNTAAMETGVRFN